MSKKAGRIQRFYVRSWTAAILVSLAFSNGQSAEAAHENREHFREFRAQNLGMDRRAAKQMFCQERRDNGRGYHHALSGFAGTLTSAPNGFIKCGTPDPNPKTLHRLQAIDGVANQTLQLNDSGHVVRLESGVNLDLGSSEKNITLGQKLFESVGSIEIQTGGEKREVSAGSHVTAAEYVAVKQVMNGHGQQVALDANGTATGGSVDLSALTSDNDVMRASNLVVPQSVTTLGDFSKGSDFRLLGDLSNYGNIQAFDSDGRARGGAIRAESITNQNGASISSDVDLLLSANHDFSNQGTITSNGNLTISAGGKLSNEGNVSAQKTVNVNAHSVTNSGALLSQTGDVNFDLPQESAGDGVLDINNSGGTISALNGNINVRTLEYTGACDTFLTGGNLFSQQLNLNSGGGTVNVNVNQLTGIVSSTGLAAHVLAATDELTIGSTCLVGDPTFFNTGAITITGNITVAEALTIVAGSNINLNGGFDLFAGDVTKGYPITLVAGATFTNSGGANQTTLGPIDPPNPNNGSVTITSGSLSGGSIVFSAGVEINSRPTAVNGNLDGGDVLLAAFQGIAGTSGRVVGGIGTQVTTGGLGFGNNGNVTVIAPSVNGVGTLMPQINTVGGTGFGGFVTALAVSPIANNVVYQADGSLALGSPTIVPNNAFTAGGEITFFATSAGQSAVTGRADQTIFVDPNSVIGAKRVIFESGDNINAVGSIVVSDLFSAVAQGDINTRVGPDTGEISAPNVVVNSQNGVVGNPGGGLGFRLQGGLGTNVQADGALGVNIEPLGIPATITGGSVINGDFTVLASGAIDVVGNITVTNGDINIFTVAGGISSTNGVAFLTNNGNINIATEEPNKKLATIKLTSADITALGSPGLGDVLISVGQLTAPVAGKAPKQNITIDIQPGGQIFFGKRGITTVAPISDLTAKNANIVFNNPVSKKAIVLEDVSILADPPGGIDMPVSNVRHSAANNIGPISATDNSTFVWNVTSEQMSTRTATMSEGVLDSISNLATINQLLMDVDYAKPLQGAFKKRGSKLVSN